MRSFRSLAVLALLVSPLAAQAQDAYKVEPFKAEAPAGLADEVKASLSGEAIRVLDPEGKPLAELWTRKAIPATGKPSGTKGAVLFPVLNEGELLGAVKFVSEGHDYRDQSIPPGVYTLRYGLQPVNGDHLGVSPYRDYGLLLPAAKDATLEALPAKKLHSQSAQAAGSAHPAVLVMAAPPGDAKSGPAMVNDQERNTWGVVLPLSLAVPGESSATPLNATLIVVGVAP